MAPSMKYWDDWVDSEDMDSMWGDPAVCAEWIAAGEKQGHKVHISRNSGGKPYVTQTEMKVFTLIMYVAINFSVFNKMMTKKYENYVATSIWS